MWVKVKFSLTTSARLQLYGQYIGALREPSFLEMGLEQRKQLVLLISKKKWL